MQYTAAEKLNEGNDASKTFIETDDAPIRNGSLLHGAASYCTGRSPDLCAFHRRTRRWPSYSVRFVFVGPVVCCDRCRLPKTYARHFTRACGSSSHCQMG